MQNKQLGKSNLYVSPVGLGCMGFSHAYGKPTEKQEAVKTIKQSYDMGYTFFDTAECYIGANSDGTISYNEELVGEALKSVRDKVIIATKFGVKHNEDRTLSLDSSPSTIRKSVEGSLKKLKTDYIDLYYQHRTDPKIEPEIVAQTISEFIKEGKIRTWGISEVTEDYLRRANAVCPVTAIQNRYSMMSREHEKIFPVIEELGISFVAFSPMANGLLSCKYTKETKFTEKEDYRNFLPQFTKEGMEKAQELLNLLNKIAEEKNVTAGQISIAWMMNKKNYIIPIPGSRKIERLQENFNSAKIVLTEEEIKNIDTKLDTTKFLTFTGSKTK
ncbi:aldo/keto reductase [Candidatus Ruminimicrobium bovinum]|uniref:aldo/keto reductase n=1 Tax=Candidatus Ruminimicrobium bovinum TaxID=3242779 RepID=UPI0039B993B9